MQLRLRRTEPSALSSTENPHTDQYLQLDSHQPLGPRLGVIKTLQHSAKEITTTTQRKKKEQYYLKQHSKHVVTQTVSTQRPPKSDTPAKEDKNECHRISILNLSRVKEKFKRILHKHDVQTLQHTQTKTSTLEGQYINTKTKEMCLCCIVPGGMNCKLVKLKSLSINEWPNTDMPHLQDKTQQYTYT